MATVRERFADLADSLNALLPEGADKDYVMICMRTAAMWANVTITRHADGSPRVEEV